MVAGASNVGGHEARARVTGGAERADVVAVAAGRRPSICRRGMPREKSVRMIPGAARRGVRTVTLEAVGTHVTAGAAGRSGGRHRAVPVGEVLAVIRRCGTRDDRRRARPAAAGGARGLPPGFGGPAPAPARRGARTGARRGGGAGGGGAGVAL